MRPRRACAPRAAGAAPTEARCGGPRQARLLLILLHPQHCACFSLMALCFQEQPAAAAETRAAFVAVTVPDGVLPVAHS